VGFLAVEKTPLGHAHAVLSFMQPIYFKKLMTQIDPFSSTTTTTPPPPPPPPPQKTKKKQKKKKKKKKKKTNHKKTLQLQSNHPSLTSRIESCAP